MSTTTDDATPPTRRERQRQATYEEIVQVSRRLLTSQGGLSLRAVATEMGMTAPALYRYVDSHAGLQLLVMHQILQDVIGALDDARSRYPDDDPAAQILASAVAFRRWARTNREEFALVFANTSTAKEEDPADDPESSAARFDAFFAPMFAGVWERYDFALPADDELDPVVVEQIRVLGDGGLPCVFPERPAGLSWMFIRAWLRLYGTVTLEVFGHMDPVIIESGALFRAMLEDVARDLSFGDDWPRLQALLVTELDR